MLNNCHVCWWAGILCKQKGEEELGDVCPPLSPKASTGRWRLSFHHLFLPCLCHCFLLSGTERDLSSPTSPCTTCPYEPASAEIHGALWMGMWHYPYCEPGEFFFLLPFFFLYIYFFLIIILNMIMSKNPPGAETISRFYIVIFLFTFTYSLLIIPLTDMRISDCIS